MLAYTVTPCNCGY